MPPSLLILMARNHKPSTPARMTRQACSQSVARHAHARRSHPHAGTHPACTHFCAARRFPSAAFGWNPSERALFIAAMILLHMSQIHTSLSRSRTCTYLWHWCVTQIKAYRDAMLDWDAKPVTRPGARRHERSTQVQLPAWASCYSTWGCPLPGT